MQLSIIIVNYNVRFFLEQCLFTLRNAVKGIEAEIIVADNHSSDGSLAYLQPLFPEVRFLANDENLGFAKANNQALAYCTGEYILFLNPDTLVPEDCLQKCMAHLGANAAAGALGVKMLDGRGRFLAESKRAFPSPLASFCKLTGLSALFPRSGFFNRYALGNLSENENHKVAVLAGAFLMLTRKALEKVKGFDERYFLYGEDIDLCYRIRKAGFENLYYAGTSILHFKGESSVGRELSRVGFFYQAMLVFVQQHYSGGYNLIFSWFIRLAITIRGLLAGLHKISKPVLLPVTDFLLAWLSIQAMRLYWIYFIRNGLDFGPAFIPYAILCFAGLFTGAAAFMGLYDNAQKTSRTLVSLGFAVLLLLAAYSLLPESLRFSRGVILWGGALAAMLLLLYRRLFFASGWFAAKDGAATGAQTLIAGSETEYRETEALLEEAMEHYLPGGRIAVTNDDQAGAVCSQNSLGQWQKKLRVSSLIFCIGIQPLSAIIAFIEGFPEKKLRYLFHAKGSGSIVGASVWTDNRRQISLLPSYHLSEPYQQRMKRLVDLLVSMLILLCFPLHFLFHQKAGGLLKNAVQVFSGRRTWLGYAYGAEGLPFIKQGVISHLGNQPVFGEEVLQKADKYYAKNYDWWNELLLVIRHYQALGG